MWPQRPPVVMPHPDPNFAALRVTWAPLYQQRLQLLAAKIGLSADPPCLTAGLGGRDGQPEASCTPSLGTDYRADSN